MRRYTQNEIDNIITDYDNGNGLSYDELSQKYNRSPKAIASKLQSLHIYQDNTHKWSDEDILFLKKHYPNGDWDLIHKKFPNVSKASIYTLMSKYGIKQINESAWTQEELVILRNNYSFGEIDKICKLLPNRTYKAITTKAKKIGLHTRELWTDKEKQLLINVYEKVPINEVEQLFPNKNRNSIIHQAMRLHLTSYDKNIWTNEDDDYIKNNWELQPDAIMAEKLNRTKRAVQARRLFLGIYRRDMESLTYETLAKYIRGNIQQWKKDSMKECNYKCIFTGSKRFQIHHLYGVSNILNDIMTENNFPIYDNFSEYSDEELNEILNAFIIKQNKYPLGVCIEKDIHVLFHSLYGQYYNTPKQWYQFEKDFKAGIYDQLLKSA